MPFLPLIETSLAKTQKKIEMNRLFLLLRLLVLAYVLVHAVVFSDEYEQQDGDDAVVGAEIAIDECRSLYGWNDYIGNLDGRNYTGIARVGEIHSLDTPIFDNEYLEGNPIAALRGSMVDDMVANFATGTLAYTFYDNDDQLVVHFGVSTKPNAMTSPSGHYGIPIGGTGFWTNYKGLFVYIQSQTREYESPSIMNYTVCPL